MRNTFAAVRPERARPALELVNTSQPAIVEQVVTGQAGITASEAATAVGCDPTRSAMDLWRQKTNRQAEHPEAAPHDETHPGYWKTLLEPLLAAVYTKRTGHRLKRVNNVLCHPSHPWMQAHMGWEVMLGLSMVAVAAVLEGKVVAVTDGDTVKVLPTRPNMWCASPVWMRRERRCFSASAPSRACQTWSMAVGRGREREK